MDVRFLLLFVVSWGTQSRSIDIFIGLNVVRILSIIALLLVFASSIVVMVHDIQAVNHFVVAGKAGGNSTSTDTQLDSDYIEYVFR